LRAGRIGRTAAVGVGVALLALGQAWGAQAEAERIVSQDKTVFTAPPGGTPSRPAAGPLPGNGDRVAAMAGSWKSGDVQAAPAAAVKMVVIQSANDPTRPVPGGVRWFGRQHADYVNQTKNKKFDLCFLGDSITDGWPRDMFNQYFGRYNVVNFGIGGDRTENVLWRLQNGELVGTSPKVIVLLIGTNNSGMNTAEEMAVGIAAVVKALRTGCPQSRILLLGVFPKRDMTLEKTRAVNAIISKLDDNRVIRYLDVGANLLDKDGNILEGVLRDAVHLTRKGFEIWGEAMSPLLAEMMASDPVSDLTKPVPRDVRWFQRMHAIYVGQTKNKKFDLCFLGDSITQMWPADMFGKHFGKYHAVNFGIGGDRTENVLWRLENGELAGTSPKVIVLSIGTNNVGMNTAEEVAVGITAVVRSLRTKCPQSRILLLGIFPSQDTPAEKTNAINAIVAKLDDGKMIRYLDVGAKLLDKDGNIQDGVLGDGVQLTRKGYAIWAEAMNPVLAEMMEEK